MRQEKIKAHLKSTPRLSLTEAGLFFLILDRSNKQQVRFTNRLSALIRSDVKDNSILTENKNPPRSFPPEKNICGGLCALAKSLLTKKLAKEED